jgi:lipoate-protein ligase B
MSLSPEPKSAWMVDLGEREYGEVWSLQLELLERRQRGEIQDLLLLVEHPDVITVGRRAAARQNILQASMPVFEIERGGDVTYHGPGQLVGYPLLRLDEGERDLHAYLRALEAGLIRACADVGLSAGRRPGLTGVWLGDRKVASIGIAVRRWVTLHGFALNVATDLERFAAMKPCGLDASVMTSLSAASGRPITVESMKPIVAARMGDALGRSFRPMAADALSSVTP